MRRSALVTLLVAACAFFAAPALAQTSSDPLFVKAGVGPSFGTFGSTPAIDGTIGYALTDKVSLGAEVGVLPHVPFDKSSDIAPNPSLLGPGNDLHVNAYHANANLLVQQPWKQVTPYATAGFGLFSGTAVATTTSGNTRVVQYTRDTHPAFNLGFGANYRLNDWLGVNADYRHFVVNTPGIEHVNRFATGVSVFLK